MRWLHNFSFTGAKYGTYVGNSTRIGARREETNRSIFCLLSTTWFYLTTLHHLTTPGRDSKIILLPAETPLVPGKGNILGQQKFMYPRGVLFVFLDCNPKFSIQRIQHPIQDPAAAIPTIQQPYSYQPHTIAYLIEVSVVKPTCYLSLLAMLLSKRRTTDFISLRQSSKLTKSYHIYPISFFIHVQII